MGMNMTMKQVIACNTAIHTAGAAAAAVGGGLAQIPGSDSVPIVTIQTMMVVSLAKIFGKDLAEGAARAVVSTGLSTMVGRGFSQLLIGWLPGVGNVINASTAAVVTETLGWIVVGELCEGRL